MISAPILARLYGPGDYGALGAYSAASAIGLSAGALQYSRAIAVCRDDREALDLLRLSVVLGLIVATLGALACSCLFAGTVPGLPIVPFALVYMIHCSANAAQLGIHAYLLRFQEFRVIGLSRTCGFVSAAAVSVFLGSMGVGWHGLLIGVVTGPLVTVVVASGAVSRPTCGTAGLQSGGLTSALRRHARYPAALMPAAMLSGFMQSLIVSVLRGGGSVELGLFMRSRSLADLPSAAFGRTQGQILKARYSFERAGYEVALRQGRNAILRMLALGIALGLGFGFLAPWLIPLYLGEDWLMLLDWRWAVASLMATSVVYAVIDPVFVACGLKRMVLLSKLFEFALLGLCLWVIVNEADHLSMSAVVFCLSAARLCVALFALALTRPRLSGRSI